MKNLVVVALFLVSAGAVAQDLPQQSPRGRVEQIVGLTKVVIDYSRPSVRDRVIFGDLLPYGQVWRTGANACTTIECDGPVEVEGTVLPAGKYAVFTIPSEDIWVIIFNKDTALWGEEDRKDSLDVLRVKVPHGKSEVLTETLTIGFENVKDDKARIDLRWEHVLVSIAISADATTQARANIQAAIAKPDADFRVFNNSARFYVDRGMEPQQALKWAMQSVAKEKKFWNLYTLALAQAQNGMYPEAIASAEASMKLAQEAKYDAYVK